MKENAKVPDRDTKMLECIAWFARFVSRICTVDAHLGGFRARVRFKYSGKYLADDMQIIC